jgi:hypothetical protein
MVLCGANARGAEDEAAAKAAFEKAYEAGAAAAIEKKWAEAEKQFDAALKALGDNPHAKRAVAQVLLNKARDMNKQESSLTAAAELLRLKQWSEAEKAYKQAAETLGESDAIKAGIAAAQAGARLEKDAAAKSAASTAPPPVAPPPVAPPPVPEKKPAVAEKQAEALEVPHPIALDRDEWLKGGGSQCYWEGERLQLQEGDEYFKKPLRNDFAVTISLEARMDHRSQICIELRAPKDSGSKTRITGWGSKEGSAPMLMVDKDEKARGDAQPPREQITLSFVRTDRKIEFYCDGKLIGNTWDAKLGQEYILWVCGKGIMDGAKVVER